MLYPKLLTLMNWWKRSKVSRLREAWLIPGVLRERRYSLSTRVARWWGVHHGVHKFTHYRLSHVSYKNQPRYYVSLL